MTIRLCRCCSCCAFVVVVVIILIFLRLIFLKEEETSIVVFDLKEIAWEDMIVLYVYTPVQQNNNIFLLISLNPTLVVCRKKSVLSVSLSLSLSLALLFLFTRHEVRLLVVILKSRKEGSSRSRGKLIPKIVTCSRAFDHFLLYKKKGRRRKTGGGEGHLFSHFSL